MEKNKSITTVIFILILFSLIHSTYATTFINEIMYNPSGSDNNKEYIEIYSDEFQIITNLSIRDTTSEAALELLKEGNNNYHLIVEEGFNYSNINSAVYSVGATIGNQLGNTGDLIIILNNNTIIDATHYYPEWGANGNNKSLCLLQSRWIECIQSPGNNNTIQTFMNIRINEFLPDPEGHDDAPMPEGEWIELYNLGETVDLKGAKLKDEFDESMELLSADYDLHKMQIRELSYSRQGILDVLYKEAKNTKYD